MNLELQNQLFIVGGATSGFGKAIAEALLQEGAAVVAIARSEEGLNELKNRFLDKLTPVSTDITRPEALQKIMEAVGERQLHGMLLNAGGPPALSALEAAIEDWDEAYRTVLRWKIMLTNALIGHMLENEYGRILFIESASVKQPIQNLVLSNAMRMAVVGYAKTLSEEVAGKGVTVNILAPGSHATPAINRLINKKVEQTGREMSDVKDEFARQTGTGFLGKPEDLASLAVWLLSAQSRFVTGQTISVAGGAVKGTMG